MGICSKIGKRKATGKSYGGLQMMKEYIMALDQGTTSSRCILFDHAGKIVTMAQKEFTQIYPQPGWVEQNPREIWSSQMSVAIEAMANIGASSKNIRAIGITNQRETTIVWDKKTGEPVYNAIVWQCRRTAEQIDELKAHADDINYDVAKAREKEVRHDVMSHVYAYGVQCPKAKGIIHLGATSCYVGDNTDIIVMAEALKLVRKKLVNVIAELSKFADKYKDQPTLAFTHFQPAQPTTVGKRATLWTQEFLMDLEDLEYVLSTLKLLGSKGTTGTQASFLELFDGDQETIDKIDPMIAEKMGFENCYPVSGQTYSRKVDTRVLNILAGIAASAHKMSNDIRLLQHLKEVEEPFEKSQIGSSAMAYKRNPMRSERIASLSRYVMVDALNPAITSATQWFERTLDDSANKRLSVPEGFLAIDGILDLCLNVVDGLVVYPKVIEKRLRSELPFMATENIMMDAVKAGGDRQELHERIRELSMEAGKTVKVEGKDNNLLELIAADPAFNLSLEDLQKSMDPKKYIGRAKEQTERFVNEVVQPILDSHKELLGVKAEINV